MSGANLNAVFYADFYHPIQAGSIDGTDIVPHDSAVYRAVLCSAAGLYDPLGDPKIIGDPYCTLFVGRLSRQTSEDTLRKAMSLYGRVKNMRLVRDIVTGASRGYAFVEYETEREMRRAYMDAHHSIIDDSEVIVDYNRQQLMPGWIPRRLGGGLGGNKESGQLRFGGRERPFRAPLRPIPYDDLKRLGIPRPPEGRYMSRFQVPSPPRRGGNNMEREASPAMRRASEDKEEISPYRESSHSRYRRSTDRKESSPKQKRSYNAKEDSWHWSRRSSDKEEAMRRRSSPSAEAGSSQKRDRHHHPESHEHKKFSPSPEYSS